MERNIEQYAAGNNIQQAGGDILIGAPQPIVKDGLIPCPECGHEVSPSAYTCLACGFPVLQYFYEKKRREKDRRLQIRCVKLMAIGLVGFLVVLNVELPPFIESILASTSAISFLLAYLICFHHPH